MKSLNQISLKILTLALLLIANCEVWAVLGNQIQNFETNIETFDRIQYPQDYYKILDLDIKFKPLFYNFINNNEEIFILTNDTRLHCLFCCYGVVGVQVGVGREVFTVRHFTLCANHSFHKLDVDSKISNLNVNEILKISNQIVSNGTGGGDWNSIGTWVGGKIPQSGDKVIVAEGDKLVINSDVYVNSLVLKSNAVVRSDSWARRIVINKDLQVSDSASIISNFGSGKLDCYITAANDGKSLISIAPTAKVNFENLKILGETFFEKGNMDVMNFSAFKPQNFIAKTGTVLNIGQKK